MNRAWWAALALIAPMAAHAEEASAAAPTETPDWTLQVDPLTTALGFVHVQVERVLTPDFSVYVGPSLRLFSGLLGDEDYLGLGAEAGVRWFVQSSAPTGWWAEVRGVGAHLSTPDDETAWGGYVSALGGYTAIFGGWFVLSGGVGVQYLHYRVAGLGPVGVLPAAHTTIGVAF
ncbi:MAG: hypothetical protein KC620_04610 [Myxococcales bacterium]|nr:hypothetical protein [Myxococcales bacterium]